MILIEMISLIQQNKKDMFDSNQIIYFRIDSFRISENIDYLITVLGYKPYEIGVITFATSKPNRLKIQYDFTSEKVKLFSEVKLFRKV
ncbi:MAG: hypothetical protein P0Y62_06285 [Candidatus Chryseobacterium colombiense]|nr:hypothetical protein [Chryseobacterium sp.]WEK71161.1 MAG: hypothetical protein P0Y62_06285 [Chryseobacterium sp.]